MSCLNYTGCVKRTGGPAGIKESNFNQSSIQRKWLWQRQEDGYGVKRKSLPIDGVIFKQSVVLCLQDNILQQPFSRGLLVLKQFGSLRHISAQEVKFFFITHSFK